MNTNNKNNKGFIFIVFICFMRGYTELNSILTYFCFYHFSVTMSRAVALAIEWQR